MAALGSITSDATSFSVPITGYQGTPPEAALELTRSQRSGVAGQDYIFGGEHGVQGTMRISWDNTSANSRAANHLVLEGMRGDNVTIVLGEDTWTGYKLINIVGAPELQTLSVAVGGSFSGQYLEWATILLERVY